MLTVGLNYNMLTENPGVLLDVALMAIKYMYLLTKIPKIYYYTHISFNLFHHRHPWHLG